MKSSFDPDQQKTIQEVLGWYQFEVGILGREKGRVLSEQESTRVESGSMFFEQTPGEIKSFFESQRRELDFVTMFFLMAAAEAEIRVDYQDRVVNRLKDPVSRRFKQISDELRKKRRQERVRLEEVILNTWMDLRPKTKQAVGEFKGALKLRDWLAHGRYWTPRMGRDQYSPNDVYDISSDLLQAIGL